MTPARDQTIHGIDIVRIDATGSETRLSADVLLHDPQDGISLAFSDGDTTHVILISPSALARAPARLAEPEPDQPGHAYGPSPAPEFKFSYATHNCVPDAPLIYRWSVTLDGRTECYIGKTSRGADRPLSAYARAVTKLMAGQPYRPDAPNGFRRVHRAMAACLQGGGSLHLDLVETASLPDLARREQYYLLRERPALNGDRPTRRRRIRQL